jgi:DNA helicase-2/ATP-dependent DNA helicase PcrA
MVLLYKTSDGANGMTPEQTRRANKGLFTSHGTGYPVTLRSHSDPEKEAHYIADEIRRLIAHSGNMLGHDDFAILREHNSMVQLDEAHSVLF